MYFYRTMKPLNAMTFDLDDTLYNNYPVIVRAEEESVFFLKNYHPALSNISRQDYYLSRNVLRLREPEIYHNVTNWRWKTLEFILLKAGLNKNNSRFGADYAMDIIMKWRNKIYISSDTHIILSELSKRWPLIAITNGNADLTLCGLHHYFNDILFAGKHGRAKPYTDMYRLAAKRLGFPCNRILHVGNDFETDIKGAIYSGMQSCWTNQYNRNCNFYKFNMKLLPHLKISKLLSLTQLL